MGGYGGYQPIRYPVNPEIVPPPANPVLPPLPTDITLYFALAFSIQQYYQVKVGTSAENPASGPGSTVFTGKLNGTQLFSATVPIDTNTYNYFFLSNKTIPYDCFPSLNIGSPPNFNTPFVLNVGQLSIPGDNAVVATANFTVQFLLNSPDYVCVVAAEGIVLGWNGTAWYCIGNSAQNWESIDQPTPGGTTTFTGSLTSEVNYRL
jgi:hypothetical protein